MCYQCGKIGHVKKFCLMSNTTTSVGQTLDQVRALVVGLGRAIGRHSGSAKSVGGSSSRT